MTSLQSKIEDLLGTF
jgi:hypothetical protein